MDGFDERKVASSLREMLHQGRVDDLIKACQTLSPSFIKSSLGYESLDEDAHSFDTFIQEALTRAELTPAERFALTECFSWEYLTSLVHVDDSYMKGVSVNLDGCIAAISEVQSSLSSSDAWSLGPDASLSPQQVNTLQRAGDGLGEVSSIIRSLAEELND